MLTYKCRQSLGALDNEGSNAQVSGVGLRVFQGPRYFKGFKEALRMLPRGPKESPAISQITQQASGRLQKFSRHLRGRSQDPSSSQNRLLE